MTDDAHPDTELGRRESTDEGEQVESWLREAVRAPHAPRLPALGQVVGGKYRIEQLLGRGGMGAVFRARHLVTEKPVAIKWMLESQPGQSVQVRQRFLREALAGGRVEHPNVVDLYDIGEDAECCFLVMELLRGESLRARLEHGPLEPKDAVQLLLPAMHGVAAAHRVGVIHRDLKPDNLFLCREADGRITMKVLDFGISSVAVAAAAPNHATLTQAGMLLGSLAYMSPEQLGDSHAVDARTDVYAFGVILYEVLTGRLPFEGATVSALAVAIVTGQPPRPSTLRPGIPLALEDIVVRAFARDRLERYPEMSSLIDALAPFTAAEADGDFRASVVRRSTAGIGDHASGAHGERSGARARAPVWLALGIGAVLLGLAGVVYQRSRGEHFSPFFQRGEARTPLPPAAAATPSIPAALAPAVVPEPPPASADEAASVVPVPAPAPAQPARESRALSRSQGARRVSTKSKPKPQHTAAMPESALFSGRK